MVKQKFIVFLIALAVVFLNVLSVHAADDKYSDNSVLNWAIGIIMGVLKDFANVFLDWMGRATATVLNSIILIIKPMILWNPDVSDMRVLAKSIEQILVPVYILAIIITGVYFFFGSMSPTGRVRAKDMILKLIFSMVIVTIATEIFGILVAISGALSSRMLAGMVVDSNKALGWIATKFLVVMVASGINIMSLIPILYLTFVLLAAVVVGLRIVFVFLMAAIFPLTIFLYFFDYTKGVGSKLMKFSLLAIFTQTAQALILAVTVIAINSASQTPSDVAAYLCMFVGMGGFIMIILAPLMLLGIMEWIGGAVGGIGSVVAFMPGGQLIGSAMVTAGGLAAGMGAGSLIAGGTMYGLGHAYSGSHPQQPMPQQRQPQQPQKYRSGELKPTGDWFNRMDQDPGGFAGNANAPNNLPIENKDMRRYRVLQRKFPDGNRGANVGAPQPAAGAGSNLTPEQTDRIVKEAQAKYGMPARESAPTAPQTPTSQTPNLDKYMAGRRPSARKDMEEIVAENIKSGSHGEIAEKGIDYTADAEGKLNLMDPERKLRTAAYHDIYKEKGYEMLEPREGDGPTIYYDLEKIAPDAKGRQPAPEGGGGNE